MKQSMLRNRLHLRHCNLLLLRNLSNSFEKVKLSPTDLKLNLPNAGDFQLSMKNICQTEEKIKKVSSFLIKQLIMKNDMIFYYNLFRFYSWQILMDCTNGNKRIDKLVLFLPYRTDHPTQMVIFILDTWLTKYTTKTIIFL